MENEDNTLDELLSDITGLINQYPIAIERQAVILQATGKDPELVEKLVKAADTMRDRAISTLPGPNIMLQWLRAIQMRLPTKTKPTISTFKNFPIPR